MRVNSAPFNVSATPCVFVPVSDEPLPYVPTEYETEYVGTASQFAVNVTLPFAVDVRFLKHTFPVAPFMHLVDGLLIVVDGLEPVPHFAVDVLSPLVTVQPANV